MLTILYGTQTGNAERIAFLIARLALKRGVSSVVCKPADEVPLAEWSAALDSPVLFVCANANQGEAPNTFRQTWAQLLQPTCPSLDGLPYAVFGLGDSLYPKFNYIPKMLHNRLKQLGGVPLLLRGLGDESDAKGLCEALLPWLAQLWEALGLVPPGSLAEEDSLDAPLFSLLRIEYPAGAPSPQTDIEKGDNEEAPPPAAAAVTATTTDAYAENTISMRVTATRRLTAEDHLQEVRHLELSPVDSTTKVVYDVGDALGVYCRNPKSSVDEFLRLLKLQGTEAVFVTPDTASGIVAHTARPYYGRRDLTVRTLVERYFDLEAVAPQEFFWMLGTWIAHHGAPAAGSAEPLSAEEQETQAEVAERLLELASCKHVVDYLNYSHREKRNVCEVLQDFSHVLHHKSFSLPPLELLLTFVPPMLPRYFSFASAPALDGDTSVHLCVAKLDWQTPLKRHRTGMCSSALVASEVGAVFPCFVWQGTLTAPDAPLASLLCVATGSGIAPVRSLIRQCAGLATRHPELAWKDLPVLLVFGCRNREKDFLYHEEWESLRDSGALPGLRVVPAFSRDTDKKVYVQHKLGEHAQQVGALILDQERPVLIYVCGNAKLMPKDVRQTLDSIAEAVAPSEEDGQLIMKAITREGRYQVDTWSA